MDIDLQTNKESNLIIMQHPVTEHNGWLSKVVLGEESSVNCMSPLTFCTVPI